MVRVHFLDVGADEYGDAVLCEVGGKRVLIDGAHPGDQRGKKGHRSIPDQLTKLLGDPKPIGIDLLVVTHAHNDHIGCLPSLVADGVIQVEWALVADPELGWGRGGFGPDTGPADPRVARLVAGIREEVLSDRASDQAVTRLLSDAATLEDRYIKMLSNLEAANTNVVRYGPDDVQPLLDALVDAGLEILGPSREQLDICAAEIARLGSDAVDRVTDLLDVDADEPDAALYRRMLHGDVDSLDAADRPGPAINLQSVVTSFTDGGVKMLFAGDMQFADAQVGADGLQEELDALRARIKAEAPFSVVKLSHHGSDNGFDKEVLGELGATSLFGICAGASSSAHPNPKVLQLLDSQRDRLDWWRTDRNGLVSIEFNGQPRVKPAKGQKDDPRPNTDELEVSAPAAGVVELKGTGPESVEITIRVTVDVARQARAPGGAPRVSDGPIDLRIGGGRALPRLLFVTNHDALAANVGREVTDAVRAAIRATDGAVLYDELPLDAARTGAFAVEQLAQVDGAKGVVLVGGPSVVPPQRRDCLQPELRAQLRGPKDADDFIVWSDAPYGRRSEAPAADLPVSRVPDGASAELLLAALGASDRRRGPERNGVRNVMRPFADPIYAVLPGNEPLLVSKETTFETPPALDGDHLYLMLHGAYADATRFWGEDTANDAEALNLTNIPEPAARVVFTGCCWGALTADQPALSALPGEVPAAKPAGSSIALAFLQRGATAFIGCTGAHYSPTEEPFGYFGGPLHEAFWQHLLAGRRPAEALFAAKIDYLKGFPHGRVTPYQLAVEYKILNQYTCLGLGW
jgi:beta-lactamase superfamily II metal-dependent hydrolase